MSEANSNLNCQKRKRPQGWNSLLLLSLLSLEVVVGAVSDGATDQDDGVEADAEAGGGGGGGGGGAGGSVGLGDGITGLL